MKKEPDCDYDKLNISVVTCDTDNSVTVDQVTVVISTSLNSI